MKPNPTRIGLWLTIVCALITIGLTFKEGARALLVPAAIQDERIVRNTSEIRSITEEIQQVKRDVASIKVQIAAVASDVGWLREIEQRKLSNMRAFEKPKNDAYASEPP